MDRLLEIYKEILGECRNGCTDASSTYDHFRYRLKKPLTRAEFAFVQTLNFYAMREQGEMLGFVFYPDGKAEQDKASANQFLGIPAEHLGTDKMFVRPGDM